jgi:putative transposase
MLKQHPNTPAHLFLDDTPYFITGAIYQKRHLLTDPELKKQLLSLIEKNFQAVGWQLNDWVILDNHYHLLGISHKGSDLSKMIRGIHGASSGIIRQKKHCDLPVWWNYWDYCTRDDKDYYTKLNYLLTNPIKHGYVTNLNDYPFSSFEFTLNNKGREAMTKQFRTYPDYQHLDEIYDDF